MSLIKNKIEIKAVWMVAWPLILSNILNVSVGIADLKMVGVLGVESIAAVGVSSQIVMFVLVFMLAISGGASVLIAHASGAGDKEKVSFITAQIVLFMTITAICVVTPIGYFFSGQILAFMGAEQIVIELGDTYLKLLFAGSIFTMLNFAVTGILLGVGKTKVSFALLFFMNILNILFNYIFIFGAGFIPPMGVAGAAAGTVAARALGSVVGLWILKTKKLPIMMKFKDCLKINFKILGRVIYLGGPRSLQGIARNFSRLAVFKILALLPDSTRAISAYSLGMQVRMISSFVGLAFMSAAMTRTGHNLGAGNIELAKKSGWISAGLAGGLMTCAAIIFLLFPEFIMMFFTDDIEVIGMGRLFFMIVAISEPIMALAFSLSGSIIGRGDSISPFIFGGISDFLVLLSISYLGIAVLKLGFISIAIAVAVSALARALPLIFVYKRGKWRRNIY